MEPKEHVSKQIDMLLEKLKDAYRRQFVLEKNLIQVNNEIESINQTLKDKFK